MALVPLFQILWGMIRPGRKPKRELYGLPVVLDESMPVGKYRKPDHSGPWIPDHDEGPLFPPW